jgi:hydrogenase maturation protein HypF
VGFRPFVYGLARELGLAGFVINTSRGVTVEVEGEGAEGFLHRLQREAPPLARILCVDVEPLAPEGYDGFRIVESAEEGSFTLLSPDISVCADCLREIRDPADRRFGYPFTNCTNCGPRYSITRRVPYDRPNTTMAAFGMCAECEREYRDPADRRFHAQPNACPACGPCLSGHGPGFDGAAGDGQLIERARQLLREGAILAVKGLGGFHLAADATNPEALGLLRERKRRSNKPFAVMARDVGDVRRHCHLSETEETLLLSPRRPIVLLVRKSSSDLPDALAPGCRHLGFMLPCTPLHELLLSVEDGEEPMPPLVMTSGNRSEEPIQVGNSEALATLGDLADAFLLHDRDIFMRVDDSVLKVPDRCRFVRRARGYAPEPIPLPSDGPDVLAAGADIKNAFTLLRGPYAIVSQHIGDMENYETLRFFEETLANLKAVYRAEPVALAHDLHPGYLSTRWALEQDIEKLGVQHHHAHIVSVMAEHGLTGRVIGVAFDGTGYGADGTLWGGEFLVADTREFLRAGHLKAVPLPGGARAVEEPWRTAVSYVREAAGDDARTWLERVGFLERYGVAQVEDVLRVRDIPEVSPLSSGAGRLFDAASALLGICDRNTYEGEAAMALEAASASRLTDVYPVDIVCREPVEVDFTFTLLDLMNDVAAGRPREEIAVVFHNTVVEAVVRVVLKLAQVSGIARVCLSGGVFQNDYLLGRVEDALRAGGLDVYANELVPLNDGGISLGQAVVLRAHLADLSAGAGAVAGREEHERTG